MKTISKVLLPLAFFIVADVAAEEAEPQLWSGDVEVGAVFTSGNTDQESLKLRFDAKRDGDKWANTFHGDTLNASQDGTETANKFYLFYRLDRKLDEDRSLFMRVAYEEDQFSGFDRQTDFTAGYAQTLLNWSSS